MTKPGAPLAAAPFSLVPLRASDVEGGDSYGLMPWRASRPPFGHQTRPQHSGCLSQNPADGTVRFCSSKGGWATGNSQHDWQLPVLAPGGAVRHPQLRRQIMLIDQHPKLRVDKICRQNFLVGTRRRLTRTRNVSVRTYLARERTLCAQLCSKLGNGCVSQSSNSRAANRGAKMMASGRRQLLL